MVDVAGPTSRGDAAFPTADADPAVAAGPPDAVRERTYSYTWMDETRRRSLGAALDGMELMRAFGDGQLSAPPIADTLGFELAAVEPGRVTVRFEPTEWQYNPLGTVHGGMACAVTDTAMGCAIHTRLPQGASYTTLDIQVRFTRPITMATGPVTAVGEVVTMGQRTATARAEMRDEQGKILGSATTTCMLIRPTPDSASE